MDKVIDFININRDRYLDELKAFLAIPSISALPQHAGDVQRCAVGAIRDLVPAGGAVGKDDGRGVGAAH